MTDSSADRDPLDRLAEEFVARYRGGERPSLTEYADRLPDRADEILELFPALVEMEQLKPASSDRTGDYGAGAPPAGLPDRVGEYRILRMVGRGGMGTVYEAVQESLGRHVALKLLPPDALADPARLERFRREARSAAQLHHTNIVPVFGVGEADGRHFYAMQFISGHPLDAVIDEVRRLKEISASGIPRAVSEVVVALMTGTFVAGTTDQSPAPSAEPAESNGEAVAGTTSSAALSGTLSDGGRQYWATVARLGAQAADAVAYAHAQGVLHRDIKPANLLLDLHGTLWVTDFGLAKAHHSDNLTHTGDVVGTLRYLAPERFDGAGDQRADIYALGLTLYELMTLTPAFQATHRAKLVEQVLAANPPKPRALVPMIPRDLETVVLKAIARDPALRYQSAAALADDLRRFLEDRPVRARRATTTEQTVRWCRRNPAVASLIAAVLLATTTGAAVASFFAVRADRERSKAIARERDATQSRQQAEAATAQATAARTTAENLAEEARKRLVRLYVVSGITLQDAGSTPEALLWFHRAWQQDHADPLADTAHRVRIAGALAELPEMLGACFHNTKVCDALFSPDGRRVLTRTDGNEAYIWDYANAQLAAPPLAHAARVRHVTYSSDGKSVATASADGSACVWDATTGVKRFTLKHDGPLTWVAFHPDGGRIATAAEDKTARMWSAFDGKPMDWRLPIEAVIDHLAFSPDGSRLLTAGRDNSVRVWQVDAPRPVSPPLPYRATSDTERYQYNYDRWPRFSPDGRAVLSFNEQLLHLWPGGDRDAVRAIPVPIFVIETYFIPRSDRVLVTGSNHHALVVSLADGKVVHALGHPRNSNIGGVSPDGNWLLTCSSGGLVHRWDARTGQRVGIAQRCGDFCSAVAFSPDGSRYLASSQDGTVRVWSNGPRNPEVHPYRRDCGRANRLDLVDPVTSISQVFSPDGQCSLRWSKTEKEATILRPNVPPLPITHLGLVECARFCNDGARVVVAGGGVVRAWDASTGTPAGPIVSVTSRGITPEHLSRDDTPVQIEPLIHGGITRITPEHLSRDGTRIVCWDDEKTVSVWDLTAGRRIFGPTSDPNPGEVIFGPPSTAGKVNSAALAPDGRKLAIAIEASGTVAAWDVDTGKVLHHNKRFRGYLSQIAFSADGQRLLIFSSDNLTRIFDAETGVPIGPAVRQPSYNYATGVSPDGRRIVTVDFKAKLLRVMDVDRGERLLSIPFDDPKPPVSLWFDSAGASVNAQLVGGMALTYPLPRLNVPLPDADRLVRFLTGQQIDDTDGIEFVDQRTFSREPERYRDVFRAWKGLKASAR